MSSERNLPDNRLVPAEESSPSADVDVALVIAFITQLRRVFASPSYRAPLLPTVALEVHELSHRSDVGVDQLVEVLERDNVLAAQVLRVAGSAAFGGWSQSNISLKVAVVRLGLRNLASVVWEVATSMRVFRSARYETVMEQIRVHSTLCAHLCRLIASRKALVPEMAFLCGLLHDIGMAATLLVLSDRPKEEPSITPAVLDEVLRQTHQEVSGMIAQLWKLPADVQMVVANHHTFPGGEPPHPLCAVVALAEDLSRQLGYGVDIGPGSCDRVVPATLAAARAALGLTDEQFAELQDTGKKLADGVAHEFQPAEQKPAAPSAPAAKPAPANTTTRPVAKPPAQQQARLTLWRRLRRWMGVN